MTDDATRLLELFQNLNVLAETNADAAKLVELWRSLTSPQPVSDEDIVMRFRNLFAQLWPRLPDSDFKDDKEKRSTVVTMMLRATVEELIAHLGPNPKPLSFVLSKELQRALAEKGAPQRPTH